MKQSPEQLLYCHKICDAAVKLLAMPELETVTILTHAFFLVTIRELNLAMKPPDHLMSVEERVFPVWIIQSRESVECLMRQRVTEIGDLPLLIERARETSPQFESCAFLSATEHARFVTKVDKAALSGASNARISAPQAATNVRGVIYPDRAFTIIRYAQKSVGISVEEHEVAREA